MIQAEGVDPRAIASGFLNVNIRKSKLIRVRQGGRMIVAQQFTAGVKSWKDLQSVKRDVTE